MSLPNDPIILLSYINTQLRDNYEDLDELCASLNVKKDELCEKLALVNYEYDSALNRFV